MCISELRGLAAFQAKHPDIVVLALDTSDDPSAVAKVLDSHHLTGLNVVMGKDWQQKLGISEEIPQTVVISSERVRILHEGVLPDPVAYLEADIKAIDSVSNRSVAAAAVSK